MRGGVSRGLRGEGGFITAGTAVGVALLALVVYIVAAGFTSDTDQFGSVSVPGKEVVDLPDGDIDVYYAEGADPSAGVDLIVPEDLDIGVTDSDGSYVEVQSRGGTEPKDTDEGQAILVGQIDVPAEGAYTVDVESNDAQQRIRPALTFGEGPFAAMKDRLDSVIDALIGPLGVLVLLALVILIFIPRYRRAQRRQSYKDMP